MNTDELLNALELLIDRVDQLSADVDNHRVAEAMRFSALLPDDTIAQLRAAIRTPAETEALRGLVAWREDETRLQQPLFRLLEVVRSLYDALPEDVKARLRGMVP